MEIHESALRHGIAEDDLLHPVRNAVAIDELDDDLRLYIGPARSAALLEVITLRRGADDEELVIHAMPLRAKYRRLLSGDQP